MYVMGTCYVIMKLWIIVKAFIFPLSALDLHYEAKNQNKTKKLYFIVPCIQWETFVKVRWTARLNSQLLVKRQWSHVSFGTWWYLNAKEDKSFRSWSLQRKRTSFEENFCCTKSAIAWWLVLLFYGSCCSMRNLRLHFELLHLEAL